MKKWKNVLAISFATLAGVVLAFQFSSPVMGQDEDETGLKEMEGMEEMVGAMGSMIGPMMAGMMDAVMQSIARPETAEHMASFVKNFEEALIAKGYSKDEAMEIVLATGVPSMPSMN